MNKVLKNFLRLVVGLSILFIVLYRIGFGEIWETLKSVNLWFFPFILILYLVSLVLGGLHLWVLLLPLKRIKFLKILKYYCQAWSLGLFTPGKVGEFAIVHFLKIEGIPIGKGTAIALIDKAISVVTLVLIASWGVFLFFSFNNSIKIIGFFLGLAIIGLFFFSNFSRNIVKKHILRKYANKFNGFAKTIFEYLKTHKMVLFAVFLITLVKWSFIALYVITIFYALNISVNVLSALYITAITQMFMWIPISMSGLGFREGINIYLFNKIGVATHIAASRVILDLIFYYSIGLFFLMKIKWKK